MKKKLAAYLAAMMIVFAGVPAVAQAHVGRALYETEKTVIPEPVYAVDEAGNLADGAVNATAAIAIDGETGQALYERLPDQRLFPASITKVMTCLLTLEYAQASGKGLSERVTVDHTYTLEKGAVHISLQAGESFTIEELLYALMLKSANDAAMLLAEHVGGSVDGFAQMMNEKAQELGMTGTHYVNPHGLHDDNHYTTARDMATLMTQAIKNETFRTVIMTKRYSIPATEKTETPRKLNNSNCLIKSEDTNYYELCGGGKTGYTSKARNTMVSYAEKDGRTVVAVVLQSPLSSVRFSSEKNLLRYGLENYTHVDLTAITQKNPISAAISGAGAIDQSGALSIPTQQVPQGSDKRLVRNQAADAYSMVENFKTQIQWENNLAAPIAKGQKLGTVTYLEEGEAVFVCDIVAAQDVAANAAEITTAENRQGGSAEIRPARNGDGGNVVSWVTIALIVLIALIVVVALMLLHASRSQRSRRRGGHQRRYSGSAPASRRAPTRGRGRSDGRGRR